MGIPGIGGRRGARRRGDRRAARLGGEPLEGRIVPAGFSLVADNVTVNLPADAEAFPTCDVDVLANDSGSGLRIVAIGEPALGAVERLAGAGPDGRELLRYVPGPTFRGRDFFRYAAVDDQGSEMWQLVSVGYEQDPAPFGAWSVVAPRSVSTAAGTALRFVDADGTALVSIGRESADPALPVSVGVLLRWQPGERVGEFTAGTFTVGATSEATFSPQANGAAWLFGSVAGVNELLGSLSYLPAPGFSAPEGTRLTVQAHLYSRLVVGLGVQLADIDVRVVADAEAPRAVDDAFRVRSLSEPTLLDVLANDDPAVGGALDIIEVSLAGHSQSEIAIDAETGRIRYLPRDVFLGMETFFYTVRNQAGRVSQGRAVVTLMPEIVAVTKVDEAGTGIVVVSPDSSATVAEFVPFPDRRPTDVSVAVADLDGDGLTEIVAMENGGGQRMRAFTAFGGLIEETVVRPFAGRQTGRVDMGVGDIDDDPAAEMVFAARTARGVEIRAVDAATKEVEMTAVLRGMTGTPEVAIDDDSGAVAVVARSPAGAVMLATMDPEGPVTPARRVLVSDRDMRAIVRRNGPLVGITVSAGDADGDGTTEALVGMSFRNGLVRVLEAEGSAPPRVSMERRVPSGTSLALSAAAVDASGREAGMVWWGPGGVGMGEGSTEPRLKGRIRAVAMG